jgi:hypothetical protein
LINIGGLAIGMMVALLNALWIGYEFSWNKPFENYDRIAQVTESEMDNRYVDGLGTWAPEDRQFYIKRAPSRAEEGYANFVPHV